MIEGEHGRIDYDELGDGPTVVLVPGSCSTGAAWRSAISQWENGFRCVTTSLLGYGGTAERRAAFDTDIAHEAEILETVVRRASCPVHLVGHSFGGLVALAVALRNRVPLLSLTIIEAPAAELLRYMGEHQHYRAFRAMTYAYLTAFHAGESAAIETMIDFYGGAGAFAALPQRVRSYAVATTAVNILDWASAYGFRLTPASLARIAVPTLVMRGGASHPAVQRANELLAQCMTKASLVTIAGAAHFMITTHAEEVAWAIAHHVARTEAMRSSAAASAAMSPMHNRFAEGFLASEPSGGTLDPLSSRIDLPRLAGPDFQELLLRARTARAAALGAALFRAGWFLAAVVSRPARSLIGRLAAWRRRERAAAELYAVDERTLADLGLRRADIPFILALGRRERWTAPCERGCGAGAATYGGVLRPPRSEVG